MTKKKEYKINIEPRILELLGPSLYTNIYYVLAELIANSYDANASNVYIIQKEDCIIVEDDGTGMSYQQGDIKKYLDVAIETRSNPKDTFTQNKRRRKIGRKGVGKLAALSVSENVYVMTIKDKEKSGFILSRHVGKDNLLKPLDENEIKFELIKKNGTSIVMTDPQYGLHKTPSAKKNNLIKIFPLVDKDFKIHIITDKETVVIESFDDEMIKNLGALILLGDDFKYLAEYFDSQLEQKGDIEKELLVSQDEIKEKLQLINKAGKKKNYELIIKGWIGAYRSTRGRKLDSSDFPDNFISLLALGKLGEYNILPLVGKNKLREVYIVGQLHIDLFEETELPDMSLSNRQGYKTDDQRYQFVKKTIRDELLPRIVSMREKYADHQKKIKNKEKIEKQKKDEEKLRKKVDEYKSKTSSKAADRIAKNMDSDKTDKMAEIISDEMNEAINLIGLKQKVDAQKRKILICHTGEDKILADVVYKMLIFNDISDTEFIYSSCDSEGARIPEATSIFEYLRNFFVDSYSDKKILVLYITSNDMASSWGAVTEVGAGWITKSNHKIFNIKGHTPKRPLDIDKEWQTSIKDDGNIKMTKKEFDKFIVKIVDVCNILGRSPKSKEANIAELNRYVTVE